jgi:exosortase/archaeosortase family protein
MRVATAEGVVQALRISGVTLGRIGTGIALDGRIISVDPACSGVRLLWHLLVATSALAAIHRLPWKRGLALLSLAAVLTIPANQLRALVLVIQTWRGDAESSLLHESAGLACAALILAVLWWLAAKYRGAETPTPVAAPVRRVHFAVLILAAIAGPSLAVTAPDRPLPESAAPAFTEFTFDGVTLPLQPLPSTPMEQAFAATFPGSLGSYGWSGRQVILRRVTTATRRLHPSRDCLRAAGYDTTESIIETHADGSQWASFTATREAWKLRVRERIVSEANTESWSDPSAWFWDALLHPLNGPWRAETVIEVN